MKNEKSIIPDVPELISRGNVFVVIVLQAGKELRTGRRSQVKVTGNASSSCEY